MTEPSAQHKDQSWPVRARTTLVAARTVVAGKLHRLGAGAAATSSLTARGRKVPAVRALRTAVRAGSWRARAGIGAAAVLVLLGIGAAVLALAGRPSVSVSSGEALVQVHLGGAGTAVTSIRATSAGQPITLTARQASFEPVSALPAGLSVRVQVTAGPPSWLRWLLGSASTSVTVRTPSAAPSADVTIAARPGLVTLGFSRPVSVIDYRAAGRPDRIIRLSRPSATADVAVPPGQSGGTLQVAAAAWPWERPAVVLTTVDWLEAPRDGVPVAAADPAPGSTDARLDSPITLTFDEPVARAIGASRPRLSPAAPGRWSEPNADTLQFTPGGLGFGPGTAVTVSFDHPVSVVGSTTTGTMLVAASKSYHFSATQASVLRLQQILAQLHYLPLTFTPAPGVRAPTTFAGEAATLGTPLRGSFAWRWHSVPATLRAEWQAGAPTELVKGALMAFEASTDSSYDGYIADDETVNQLADDSWRALLSAAAANRADPEPYAYVHVSETLPETLSVWENGKTVLRTPANTGIPVDPTALGTYPVYVRYTVNTMSGTNPDGSHYDDIVYWINYFNGGDAVHGFVRASYGFPQSLGCVELPLPTAHVVFNHLAIGDLVTVAP
jgi:hypothetical protein